MKPTICSLVCLALLSASAGVFAENTGTSTGTYKLPTKHTFHVTEKGPIVQGKRHGMWTFTSRAAPGRYARARYGYGRYGRRHHQRPHTAAGKVVARVHYLNGARHGEWTWYLPNNQQLTQRYANNQLHGVTTLWNPQTKRTLAEHNFVNGVLHGKTTRWSEQGVKLAEENYLLGRPHGPWTTWFPDGKVHKQFGYDKGLPRGIWATYYANGKPREKSVYNKKHQRHGPYVRWHENGKVAQMGHYNKDKQDKEWTLYSTDGKVTAKTKFKKGRLDRETTYYSNGLISRVEKSYSKWDAGWIQSFWYCRYETWYPDGKRKMTGHQKAVCGLPGKAVKSFQRWHPNGRLAEDGKYGKPGEKKHLWRTWYDNGNKRVVSNYKNGQLHGPQITYFENGKMREAGHFNRGRRAGGWIEYHDSGQKRAAGAYVNGQRHGDWQVFSAQGTLIRTERYSHGRRTSVTGVHQRSR